MDRRKLLRNLAATGSGLALPFQAKAAYLTN